jgi:uncharacterized protein
VAEEDYAASRSEDLSQDDLLIAVHDGTVLDLDALVQEQLLLAVPSHLLCRVDCRGLCPYCGGNRNETECSCTAAQTDPRWAALKSLKIS